MLILTRKPGPPFLRFPALAALAQSFRAPALSRHYYFPVGRPWAANSQNPAWGRPAADDPDGGAFR